MPNSIAMTMFTRNLIETEPPHPMKTFEYNYADHPSWKVSRSGVRTLKFTLNGNGTLTVHTIEFDAESKRTRQTMAQLPAEKLNELREFFNS